MFWPFLCFSLRKNDFHAVKGRGDPKAAEIFYRANGKSTANTFKPSGKPPIRRSRFRPPTPSCFCSPNLQLPFGWVFEGVPLGLLLTQNKKGKRKTTFVGLPEKQRHLFVASLLLVCRFWWLFQLVAGIQGFKPKSKPPGSKPIRRELKWGWP